ncbi:MAG: anaerobic ribonucleoside-triphosphate reductase activating protein [Clostridia bacterium]|nr:anaerobic ribonucleoside-triphosphate reductase activating protein [Clostridia bacterium]
MRIRIAGTVNDSIVDGPGLRFTVFVQGCPHHCPGCHNPETHDPNGGHETDTERLIEHMKKNPLLSGLTLSGGEPMEQPEACLELAKAAHSMGLNVWCYTGYTWEELIGERNQKRMNLLEEVDKLVDGPFVLNQRSLELDFRGSKNQRIIDVKEALSSDQIDA